MTGHSERKDPRTIIAGTLADVNGGQRLRWSGDQWEPYEEQDLLPYVTERVGEWEVRNETAMPWTLPIVNGEPRPGLYTGEHDIILSVRRVR